MAYPLPFISIEAPGTAVMEPGMAERESPGRLRDKFGRAITDLRVSVTDRCNYKCVLLPDGE